MTQTIVGVLTATADVELPAILRAFDLKPDKPYDETHDSERYWLTDLLTTNGDTLRAVISCLGGSGNVESSLPTERLIRNFHPEFIIFVGIACGNRKYGLMDVVTSGAVWAYEYLKTTARGPLDRSRARITPNHVQDDATFFTAVTEWHDKLRSCISQIPPQFQPRTVNTAPALHRGVWIASGEKVLANGELARLNALHDMVRAGEMEGYGFASACEDRRPTVPWLIVRGISDYGDASKDGEGSDAPLKDEYHHAAGQSAAAFVRTFLERGYTTLDRSGGGALDTPRSDKASAARPKVVDREGIRDVFNTDSDPAFSAALLTRVKQASTTIVMAGMGLSFLKGNSTLIQAITTALHVKRSLTVEIFYGDPKGSGIVNRVAEEAAASQLRNRFYSGNWPQDHLQSLVKGFQGALHVADYSRLSIHLAPFLPMTTILKVDGAYFWYPYGTPDIRGKDSPWLVIDRPKKDAVLAMFLEACIAYLRETRDESVLLPPKVTA